MSMTSKVNPDFQKAIVQFIASRGNANTTNDQIFYAYVRNGQTFPSRRAIQEATQKLTKAGVLASPQRGVYRLASYPTPAPAAAVAATA